MLLTNVFQKMANDSNLRFLIYYRKRYNLNANKLKKLRKGGRFLNGDVI